MHSGLPSAEYEPHPFISREGGRAGLQSDRGKRSSVLLSHGYLQPRSVSYGSDAQAEDSGQANEAGAGTGKCCRQQAATNELNSFLLALSLQDELKETARDAGTQTERSKKALDSAATSRKTASTSGSGTSSVLTERKHSGRGSSAEKKSRKRVRNNSRTPSRGFLSSTPEDPATASHSRSGSGKRRRSAKVSAGSGRSSLAVDVPKSSGQSSPPHTRPTSAAVAE